VPQDGKDDEYDEIMTEIESLEKELEADLKKFEREVGYVSIKQAVEYPPLTYFTMLDAP
jgi:hypothetical protein